MVLTTVDLGAAVSLGAFFYRLIAPMAVFLVFLGALCWVVYTMAAARFTGWSPLRFTVLTCVPGGIGLVVVNVAMVAAGVAQECVLDRKSVV